MCELKQAILGIAYEYNCSIHHDYSGRYMYGETCLGISFDGDLNTYHYAVCDYCKSNNIKDEVKKGLLNYYWDSLGKGIIVYWKNIKGEENGN